ncbi:MAG: bacillithiol biosynthesis cysteine-adding enzyme BshC [Gemmatimonadales bacterium]
MTLRLVDTPIPAPMPDLSPRSDSWRRELEPAIVGASGVTATLERLREPGALVVSTGQQPGLFVGPAYVLYKALSARALARLLETRWKRPVVPVYWVPGDDHDLGEVATAAWIGGDGALVTARLPARASDAPLTPLWREPLGEGIAELLQLFEASLPASDARDAVTSWLRRHYRAGATVAGAFAGALAELVAPLGILCLDSTHAAVKAAAAPLLLRALEDGRTLDAELAAAHRALEARGVVPGVTVGDGAALVFVDGPLGRDRLVLDGDAFHLRRAKQRIDAAELGRLAERDPRALSPNVLLRPVVESALLPTVAYVAGPGELRYLELAHPIYRRMGVPIQTPVPRWSGLVVEPRVTRLLEKLGASIEDLQRPGAELEERIARAALPEGTERAFVTLRELIERGYGSVSEMARAVDPTLERPAASARGQALHAAAELEKKLIQHARKREATELGQVQRARASIRPDGRPQERVLTPAGFLARYGTGLLDDLARHIDAWYARALEAAPVTA